MPCGRTVTRMALACSRPPPCTLRPCLRVSSGVCLGCRARRPTGGTCCRSGPARSWPACPCSRSSSSTARCAPPLTSEVVFIQRIDVNLLPGAHRRERHQLRVRMQTASTPLLATCKGGARQAGCGSTLLPCRAPHHPNATILPTHRMTPCRIGSRRPGRRSTRSGTSS